MIVGDLEVEGTHSFLLPSSHLLLNCLIVDDPVKNSEEAYSETIREAVKEWYASTAYTRLAPGGGVLIIQCMTGDTPVLMADGSEKRLDAVRIGDEVATFENGTLAASEVRNWRSNGRDQCYKITTRSGKIVRANGRHPFLAHTDEGLIWIRTKNLRVAQQIVALKRGGGSGKEKPAKPMDATNPSAAGVTAPPTTTKPNGLLAIARRLAVSLRARVLAQSSSIVTVLRSKIMSASSLSKAAHALFAVSSRKRREAPRTGYPSSASTTTTSPEKSGVYFATTATSLSEKEKPPKFLKPLPPTSDFTLDEIVSIELGGVEEVFDVQVDRTENFIANGLVSHNTRWHEDDLSGWLEGLMEAGEGDEWEIVRYPALAIADEYLTPDGAIVNEPGPRYQLLRSKGEALHPTRYDEKALARIERAVGPTVWQALYQQSPAAEDGDYFQREMFRLYDTPPKRLRLYGAWDFAIGKKERNDWTVGVTAGVDEQDNIYILDLQRGRWDAHEIAEQIIQQYLTWKPYLIALEKGQIQMAMGPYLDKRIKEDRLYGMYLHPMPTGRNDKEARARTIQGRMRQGRVFFPRQAAWLHELMNEMLKFPAGKHDDQVDALAHLGNIINEMAAPYQNRPAKKTSWRDKVLKYVKDNPGGNSHMAA